MSDNLAKPWSDEPLPDPAPVPAAGALLVFGPILLAVILTMTYSGTIGVVVCLSCWLGALVAAAVRERAMRRNRG